MDMKCPKEVEYILDLLYKEGYSGYIVGGCVRDLVLGKNPNDWDICTSAKPKELLMIFKNHKVISTGISHGTVTIIINGKPFEVTTYRIEGEYSNNRRPSSVEFTQDLLLDLSRRDFTMNAMAYNTKDKLIDPFRGETDIKDKLIKAVGDPKVRLREDALRIIRGVRFSAQLDFTIDDETRKAMTITSKYLSKISRERIQDELNKILLSVNPSKGIALLFRIEALEYIIPELVEIMKEKSNLDYVLGIVDNCEGSLELRLSSLLLPILQNYQLKFDDEKVIHTVTLDILKRLKYSNKVVNKVYDLLKEYINLENTKTEIDLKRIANRIGLDLLGLLLKLQAAELKTKEKSLEENNHLMEKYNNIIVNKFPTHIGDLAINGRDIIDIGYSKGEEIGYILNLLLEQVYVNPRLNTRKDLINIVKGIVQ